MGQLGLARDSAKAGGFVPKIYTPSNKLPAAAIFVIFLFCAAASSLTAVPCALAIIHIPLILLNLLSTAAWAFFAALIAFWSIHITKPRFPAAAGLLAVLGSLVGWCVHWAFWLSSHFKGGSATFWGLLPRSGEIMELAAQINSWGTWAPMWSDSFMSGAPLMIVWAGELFVFAAVICAFAKREAGLPFDEAALAWRRDVGSANKMFAAPSGNDEFSALMEKIKGGDFSYFVGAPLTENIGERHLELTIFAAHGALKACGTKAYGAAVLLSPKNKGGAERETLIQYEALPASLAKALAAKMA
jgi:hypothetical protein